MMRTPAQLEVQRAARDFAGWHWFGVRHGCVMFGLVAARAALECACAVARVERLKRSMRSRYSQGFRLPGSGLDFFFGDGR